MELRIIHDAETAINEAKTSAGGENADTDNHDLLGREDRK
jgi:hypothetical protein